MVFAAIDWAEESHLVLVMNEQGRVLEQERIEASNLVGLNCVLRQGRPAEEVHVAIELHSSLLLDHLLGLGVKVYGINPKSAERARDRFTPAGLKDDERDAWSLAEFLRTSHQHLRPLQPDTPRTVELQEWVGLREQLVQERTVQLQRLRSHLVNWHPQALRAVKHLNTTWALDLLERCPTADVLGQWKYSQIAQWCRGRRLRMLTIDRIASAAACPSPTTAPARHAAHALEVQHRVATVRALNERLQKIDEALEKQVENHPDAFIFRSLPHAGTVTVAAMLAGFGDDRQRWNGHEEVAARWGVVPVTVQSGKYRSVHRRAACDTTLHQAWLWFAFNTIRKRDCWAREDYQRKRKQGAEHYATLRGLGDTWVKIAYRCWYDRTAYDEQLHRQRRAERMAPRLEK
jgi:transposase